VLVCNRVAGFIIVGGQDNIQMVAGRIVRLMATPPCAGGQVSALHCQEIAAELTFRN
jgi:hypothetical protein